MGKKLVEVRKIIIYLSSKVMSRGYFGVESHPVNNQRLSSIFHNWDF